MNKEEIVRKIINKVRNDEKLTNEEKEYLLCIGNDWFLFKQENEQLKEKWNKLKEWVFGEKMLFYEGKDGSTLIRYDELRNKMIKLEKVRRMNKEELIGKLQMIYVGDRNALDEMISYFDGLKEQLDKYENPEDITLMTMWATEKVKDENKHLQDQLNQALKDYDKELQKNQEAIEYCNNNIEFTERLVDVIDILKGENE